MILKSIFLDNHQSPKSEISVSLRVDILKVNAEVPTSQIIQNSFYRGGQEITKGNFEWV